MLLYLMRHGIAAPARLGGADADRPLTPEGRERTACIARELAALSCAPVRIWSSPLRRAMETAEIVADSLGADMEPVDFLAPGGEPGEALRTFRNACVSSGMMVGHMPDLCYLAAHCIPGLQPFGLQFKKAGVAEIIFDERPVHGGGRLNGLLQPRHLLRSPDPSD